MAVAGLDPDRTAFAISVLAHCTLDLKPPVRARFWMSYAETRATEVTGDRRLLDELGLRVARLAAHLQTHGDSFMGDDALESLRRRYDERAETELELDPSEETRMRLARQMVDDVDLSPVEEIAAALALSAQNGGPVPSSAAVAANVALADDDLELEALDSELSSIVASRPDTY